MSLLYSFWSRLARFLGDLNSYHALYYMIVDRDFVDKEGHVLIPDYKIAVWCGSEGIKQYLGYRFNAEKFLKAFKKDVLPSLEWSTPVWMDENHETGQCRHIINETIADLVDSHLFDFDTERYSIVAGTKHHIKAARERHSELVDDHKALVWPYPSVQNDIAQYLLDLPFSLFTRQITDKRVEEAKDCIVNNPYLSDTTKRKELNALHCVADMPKPFYNPGGSGKTARLIPTNSLCTIDRKARRILCEGWYELDLKGCYPAIAARLWKIECIQDMLGSKSDSKADVWDKISRELGIPDEYRGLTRDAVKQCGK